MLKAFMEKVEAMVKPEVVSIVDRRYSTKPLYPVLDPEPKALGISTLTGLVDYYEKCEADVAEAPIVIVEAPDHVRLVSALEGEFLQRKCFLEARTEAKPFPFGQYLPIENVIVGLQAQFVPGDTTKSLLAVLGNLQDGQVVTFGDDGTSQSVTAKTGVVRVGTTVVPNPIELAPYRTFPEIEQPASKFVLRLKSGDPSPACALFEADGGAWRNVAIASIKTWIAEKLPTAVILA